MGKIAAIFNFFQTFFLLRAGDRINSRLTFTTPSTHPFVLKITLEKVKTLVVSRFSELRLSGFALLFYCFYCLTDVRNGQIRSQVRFYLMECPTLWTFLGLSPLDRDTTVLSTVRPVFLRCQLCNFICHTHSSHAFAQLGPPCLRSTRGYCSVLLK